MNKQRAVIESIKRRLPASFKMKWRSFRYNYYALPRALWARNPGRGLIQFLHVLRQARLRILFFPEVPWETSVIYQMCLAAGYRITNNPSASFDLAYKWKDVTFHPPDTQLSRIEQSQCVINYRCNDIRKRYVEAMFKEVFGYSTLVDPQKFTGRCVQKSDLNAKHDGKIIDCPIAVPADDMLYQKLIDNQVDDKRVVDLRVTVIKDQIPVVFLWYKPVNKRFMIEVHKTELAQADDVFCEAERKNILRFCQKMGLDYGELDILRDNADGRIYIIDVNNTPDGPALRWWKGENEEQVGMRKRMEAFVEAFVNQKAYNSHSRR